jgi:hypothetical protein
MNVSNMWVAGWGGALRHPHIQNIPELSLREIGKIFFSYQDKICNK